MKTDLNIDSGRDSLVLFQRSDEYDLREDYLLGEDYFHQLLSLERKRTERSGKPALLLLIDMSGFSQLSERSRVAEEINLVLFSILRDTDVKGWYRRGSVVGVILTEIGDSDLTEATDSILAKFTNTLEDRLDQSTAAKAKLSFELIARKQEWRKNGCSFNKLQPNYDEASVNECNDGYRGFFSSFVRHAPFLAAIDVLLISLAHFVSFLIYLGNPVNFLNLYGEAYALSVILNVASLYVFNLYNMEEVAKPRQISFKITYSVAFALGLTAICFYLAPRYEYGRGLLAIQAGLIWLLLIGWRSLYSSIFASFKRLPTLILGCGELGRSALQLLKAPHSQFEVRGFIDDDVQKFTSRPDGTCVIGTFAKIAEIISDGGIKAVVLAMDNNGSSRITRKILEARLCGVEVIDMLSLYERVATKLPVKYIEDQWLLFADGFHLISKQHVQKLKRIFDLLFSAILLIISLPMLLITALAIRLDSPGPIFYQQERVGKGCKRFAVYKLRSMRFNAEQQGAKWAQKRDPRVTRVGKWIRLFRIDELPQLWNVFLGQMSMVGPRPERPEFVKELDDQIPYYCARHSITPGITGWAQIKYPYGASVEDSLHKLEYDLYYVKNMSLLFDFKILLKTIGVVMLGEGAR